MSKNIIIEANNLAYKLGHSEEYLFQNINFSIGDSDRIGLIGTNGSGKSTLLKIISNNKSPTSGTINSYGKIEYVPQINLLDEKSDQTIIKYLEEKNTELWKIQSNLNEVFNWEFDLHQSIASLSGGQFMKLKICTAISREPDLILLDEPTNHMDLVSIKALELFIATFVGGIVAVSHNKSFLNNTINQVWELNNNDKSLNTYGGNFDFYISQKNTLLAADAKRYEVALKQQKKLVNIKNKMQERIAKREKSGRKKLENRRILKADYNMMKSRAEYYYGKESIKIDKRMETANHNLESNKIIKRKRPNINFKLSDATKNTLLSLSNYNLDIDDQVILKDVNMNISNGERVCILGSNGSGKTVLVKSLIGDYEYINPSGKKYISSDLNPIYLDQKYEMVDTNISLLDNILNANESISSDFAKSQLGKLQFDAETDFDKHASKLSGGETAKLALAMVTVSATRLIILDEPVNNLDMETISVFEETLVHYKGALIVISHDESFVGNIKIDRFYEIKNQRLKIVTTG